MSDTTISLTMEADVSNAVSAITGASDQIAGSLKQVESSQNSVNNTVQNSVDPLTMEEQAQLSGAASSIALQDAQTDLRAKQEILTQAVRQYGEGSSEAAQALR